MGSAQYISILLAFLVFLVWAHVWIWRDMTRRDRPVWVRVLAVALLFPTQLGLLIWMIDRSRHPPDVERSPWAATLRRWGERAR